MTISQKPDHFSQLEASMPQVGSGAINNETANPAVCGATEIGSASCGAKHDYLVEAKIALKGGPASVPLFFGLTDGQIKGLFSQETRDLWRIVCEAAKSMPEPFFSFKFMNLLEELQRSVRNDLYSCDALPLSEEQKAMLDRLEGKKLIVRSSSNEDTLDAVNAGGNKSVGNIEPNEQALRKALAEEIIVSYFSVNSLKNRSAFKDPFTEMPLCSVLVMEQISGNIVSGVMMTGKPSWLPASEGTMRHITATRGFGEGVVSGKVPCDEWVVTEGCSYATIRQKPYQMTFSSSKIQNDPTTSESPVLSKDELDILQVTARQLEDHYKRPMDVEFVFCQGQLSVVQARPIQAPEITSPTYLDPCEIPKGIKSFSGKTLVSGTSEVLSVTKKSILFADTLVEADTLYNPALHRAVIVRIEPDGANSHAEVNFTSQRPPVPCFYLPPEEVASCELSSEEIPITVCPQTGLIAITYGKLAVKQGLFLHPAQFPITVGAAGRGVQGNLKHPRTMYLHKLLTATSEQLVANLDEIGLGLDQFFTDMTSEHIGTSRLELVAEQLKTVSLTIFGAMKEAANAGRKTLLSFHAGRLRQLMTQSTTQVVGAHSFAGLEEAMHLPQLIKEFIHVHKEQETLCELALLAKKAFDESIQKAWLDFLENPDYSEKQLAALYSLLKDFNEAGQLSSWFSLHFSKGEPTIENLLIQDPDTIEFFGQCKILRDRLHCLSEAVARINTKAELDSTWNGLQEISNECVLFCSQYRDKPDLLLVLQRSQLLYDLIQLWDLNIKAVKTSRLLSYNDEKTIFADRITQFAAFGHQCCQSVFTINQKDLYDLREVLDEIKGVKTTNYGEMTRSKQFSVQHWLVPTSQGRMPIRTDDERLTVIHQNLLKASGPGLFQIEPLLSPALIGALNIFQLESQAKRNSEANGIFVSMSEEKIGITINIPLNYHSVVVTITQKRGSDAVDFMVHWRGADKGAINYGVFFELVASLTGATMKGQTREGEDSTFFLTAKDKRQAIYLSRAIRAVNGGSVTNFDPYFALTCMYHPTAGREPTMEELNKLIGQTAEKVLNRVWAQFKCTGDMPQLIQNKLQYDSPWYLEKNNLIPEIVSNVTAELTGQQPMSLYSKLFLSIALKAMPLEEQKEVLWNNLTGIQTIMPYQIPDKCKQELFSRLRSEAPEKATSYMTKHSLTLSDMEEYTKEKVKLKRRKC
jgi:hypothetical protein